MEKQKKGYEMIAVIGVAIVGILLLGIACIYGLAKTEWKKAETIVSMPNIASNAQDNSPVPKDLKESEKKEQVTKPKIDSVKTSDKDLAGAEAETCECGLRDDNGNFLVTHFFRFELTAKTIFSHPSCTSFTEEAKETCNREKYQHKIKACKGYLLEKGLDNFSECESGFRWGFMDKKGNWAIEPRFVAVREFKEGLAGVWLDYDDPDYDHSCEKNYYSCSRNWGFIDEKGKMVTKEQYDKVGEFYNGQVAVYIEGTYHIIDKKGESVARFIDLRDDEFHYLVETIR